MATPAEKADIMDNALLNRIQGDFPVSPDPYGDMGRELGMSADEALSRVRRLVASGVIRKVGPFFDAKKMGYTSTLCSVQVPADKLEEVASIINSYPEVTHNYLRAGEPNLWFTVIAESKDQIERITGEIAEKGGIGPVNNLPAIKMFKVKVDLKVGE